MPALCRAALQYQAFKEGSRRLILEKRQELGRLYNFTNILDQCRGKYVALLDGDDYWTDPLKLQKQVDTLERLSDCVLCTHCCEVKTNAEIYKKDFSFLKTNIITQNDLVDKTGNNFIPTASVLLHREYLPQPFPENFYRQPMGDWWLNLYLLSHGKKACFLKDYMSVYRREGQGVWSGSSDVHMILRKREFYKMRSRLE